MKPNKSNHRVMFLRDKEKHPVGCVAINLDRDNNKLYYQLSVLNPADHFDRKLARQLAIGRLVEAPIMLHNLRKDATMHEVSEKVMVSLLNREATPSRACKAALLWLKTNQLLSK